MLILRPGRVNAVLTLLVCSLSIALVYVSLPRFWAALNHIPVDTAIARLLDEQKLSSEQLSRLLETTRDNISLVDDSVYWDHLSRLLVYQQLQGAVGLASSGRDTVLHAKDAIEQSLQRSPGNAYQWYKLAMLNVILQSPPNIIADELLMSIMTSPHETSIMVDRLRLCFLFYSAFQEDDLDLLTSQVLLVWEASNNQFLTAIAANQKNRMHLIDLLEHRHPDILLDMVLAFEKEH